MTDLKVVSGMGASPGNVVARYREKEPDICDLVRAADIASEMAMLEKVRDELTFFPSSNSRDWLTN